VTIHSGTFQIVGPGDTATPVTVGNTSAPAFDILTTAAPATVILDGFSTTTTTTETVKCTQGASATTSLTILGSNLHNGSGGGVSSSGCKLTLDRNVIQKNPGGGVSVTKTSYTITNNFIVDNGSAGRGVSISDDSSGTFAFNTVAKNLVSAGVGGVDCGSGSKKAIESSIFDGNSMMGGSQIGAQCTLTKVVTTGGDSQGTAGMPSFANASADDYHLVANNGANLDCCIDKITTAMNDHDVDNSRRPKGSGYDIGAHEAQ
jgi:hypothetical protein